MGFSTNQLRFLFFAGYLADWPCWDWETRIHSILQVTTGYTMNGVLMVAKKPHPRFAEEVHHMVCLVQIGQLSNCCSFCNRHPHFFEKKLAYQQIIKTPQLKVGIRYLNIFKNSISCIYGICQWKLPPLGMSSRAFWNGALSLRRSPPSKVWSLQRQWRTSGILDAVEAAAEAEDTATELEARFWRAITWW